MGLRRSNKKRSRKKMNRSNRKMNRSNRKMNPKKTNRKYYGLLGDGCPIGSSVAGNDKNGTCYENCEVGDENGAQCDRYDSQLGYTVHDPRKRVPRTGMFSFA